MTPTPVPVPATTTQTFPVRWGGGWTDSNDAPAPAKPAFNWSTEPAKIAGWLVAFAIALSGLVLGVLNAFTGLIPAKYAHVVGVTIAIATAVGIAATRLQAMLTRNGVGPTGNGKDGAVAPATHQAELTETAIAVAAAKAVDPATHAL